MWLIRRRGRQKGGRREGKIIKERGSNYTVRSVLMIADIVVRL